MLTIPELSQLLYKKLGVSYILEERLNGCWECYTLKPDYTGYIKINIKGVQLRLHRVVHSTVNEDFKQDDFVLHSCDNRACVNPAHLRSGTHTDNMQDRSNRGRCNVPGGTSHYMSKLTANQVRDIRDNRRLGCVLMGRKYGVDPTTISRIRNNKIYTDVV
jgi:sirohydrochlorin ferrochelatase